MAIRIFTTGGTFDKEYDEISQKLVFRDTQVPKILKRSRCDVEFKVTSLMSVDSLEMTDQQRSLIEKNCKAAQEDKIIITHGTDTMVETAAFLAREIKGKTIVLTGALVPYQFRNSDSLFNLGTAIAFVQSMPHGIYIVINGRCFEWSKAKKNMETGMFEEVK